MNPSQALAGYVGAGAFFAVVALLYPKGIGGGDGVMAAGLGAWLGWSHVWIVILMAFGLGALASLPMLLAGRWNRKSLIAFGPYLAVSAFFLWLFPGAFDSLANWFFPTL